MILDPECSGSAISSEDCLDGGTDGQFGYIFLFNGMSGFHMEKTH